MLKEFLRVQLIVCILSYLILSYLILSFFPFLSFPFLSFPILFYSILFYFVIFFSNLFSPMTASFRAVGDSASHSTGTGAHFLIWAETPEQIPNILCENIKIMNMKIGWNGIFGYEISRQDFYFRIEFEMKVLWKWNWRYCSVRVMT